MTEQERLLMEQIKGDFTEAMADFIVFCDKWVFIEDKANHTALKLTLWPAQREIIGQLSSEQLLVLLKTRQVGLTWLSAALVLWLGIKNLLHLTVIISASEDHAIEFLNRVYFILDRLPAWMVPTISSRTKQQLDFKSNNLISSIKSMPTIEMGAESKTPNLLIIDEAHTIRNVASIYNASYPGIEQAKGRVIIIANSVKGGAGWGFVRDIYTASMARVNSFKRIFLPWMAHPERPANFRQLMIVAGMNEEDIKEHYPETEAEALSAATGSFFGQDIVRHSSFQPGIKGNLIRNKERELEFVDDDHGIIEVWRYPYYLLDTWNKNKWERRYAIGSDISEGLGGDYSVAYVYDRHLDEIVCRMKSNRVDADTWAIKLQRLSLWYDKACITVERNGAGITTIKKLQDLNANQYVRITGGKVGKSITKEYGWLATGGANGTKWELCGDLRTWFRVTKGTIYCPILIDEASTFIKFENGTLGAEIGKHDDCVISAGLMIQGSMFMGDVAKEIKKQQIGWRERLKNESKEKTAWAA
jgi:hypothetical protein